MAQSGKGKGFEYQPTQFANVITGSKIESQKWLAMQSRTCSVDSHFDKLTSEMKRLSVIRNSKFHLPPLNPLQESDRFLCVPSPLENSPLTGKKINIHRKNSPEAMWRPSEAEPVNTIGSFLGFCLPHEKQFLTHPYTRFHSGKEPGRKLLASGNTRNCSAIQGDGGFCGLKVCRNGKMPRVTDAHQDNKKFYREPGLDWTVVPTPNIKGTSVTCTVSGHEPVKVRVRGKAPILSVFHLFQTEWVFDRMPQDTVDTKQMFAEATDASSSRDLVQEDFAAATSGKVSENAEAICSNLSTGYSTATHCYQQLLDDTQEQSENAPDKSSARSKLTDNTNMHSELSSPTLGSDENDESLRLRTMLYDKDDNDSHIAATSTIPEVWIFDGECETEAVQLPNFPRCSSGVFHSLSGMCSEDFEKSCIHYDANESWNTRLNTLHNIETKLKRPPQRRFGFSKIDVHHIQSEKRKNVMKRLTKLPIRCQKAVQKCTDACPLSYCSEVPSLCTRSVLQADNIAAIPTINLNLDVNVKKMRSQLSLPAPIPRLLKKFNPNASKGALIERTIQDTVPTWCRTQFVFVGKGVFNGSVHTSSHIMPALPHTTNPFRCANDAAHATAKNPSGQVKMNVRQSELSMNSSNTFLNVEKQVAASYSSQPNKQDGMSNNVSLTVKQHASVHTERYDYQRPVANAQDSLSAWAHHRDDSVAEMGQSREFNRRHKEENGHQFSFRSASATAVSVSSLDDVPYNSPAESPCRNNSPVRGTDYISALVEGLIPESLCQDDVIYPMNAEDDQGGTDSYPEKLDVLPTGIGLTVGNGESLHENAWLETKPVGGDDIIKERNQQVLQGISKQEHEDDTALSNSTIDISPRSYDSLFFDFNDNIQPGSTTSTGGNTESKSDRLTKVSQLLPKTTFSHGSSTLHQLPLCATGSSVGPKVAEITDVSCMQDYGCGDTQTEEVPRKKLNATLQQEPSGPVYKNVRFADVDRVISFTVPELAFPVHSNSFNGIPTTSVYDGKQGRVPVLHKQTLQLAGYPGPPRRPRQVFRRFEFTPDVAKFDQPSPLFGRSEFTPDVAKFDQPSPLFGRSEFTPDVAKFNQRAQEMMKSHCLRDMKWSAHSYKSNHSAPNCMFIRGTSLELPRDGIRGRNPAVGDPCDASVMYTICQKCKEELHVKFGNRCHSDTDNIAPQKVIVSTRRDEAGIGEVRDARVGGMCQPERAGCVHINERYCNLST